MVTRLTTLVILLCLTGQVGADGVSNRLEGMIQPAGPSIYMEGSHELVDADGELVARLSGQKSEIDLDAFQGDWVVVEGDWRPTVEAGGKLFEVRKIEIAVSTP